MKVITADNIADQSLASQLNEILSTDEKDVTVEEVDKNNMLITDTYPSVGKLIRNKLSLLGISNGLLSTAVNTSDDNSRLILKINDAMVSDVINPGDVIIYIPTDTNDDYLYVGINGLDMAVLLPEDDAQVLPYYLNPGTMYGLYFTGDKMYLYTISGIDTKSLLIDTIMNIRNRF